MPYMDLLIPGNVFQKIKHDPWLLTLSLKQATDLLGDAQSGEYAYMYQGNVIEVFAKNIM